MTGKSRETVSARIREFYEANPDEELTYADVTEKFSCTYAQAYHAVKHLSRRAEVETVYVIRAGKGEK